MTFLSLEVPQAERWIQVDALKVDRRLLEERLVTRCKLEQCRAACCGHGVYVDLADAGRIIDEADLIKRHLPPDRQDVKDWFDGKVEEDDGFPSGYQVGTEVVEDPGHPAGSRCVFLRPDNRCALQRAGIAAGRHPWDLKPFFCALYPLVLQGDALLLDEENELFSVGGSCQRADPVSVPLYVLFKEEMVLALGQKGYEQLCAIAKARPGAGG